MFFKKVTFLKVAREKKKFRSLFKIKIEEKIKQLSRSKKNLPILGA